MGEIGVANERADADGAIGQMLDAIQPRQAGDIDQTIRAADAALHQVEQIGAGGKIDRTRLGCSGDRVGDRCGSDIIEGLHAERLWSDWASLLVASSTASVIPA